MSSSKVRQSKETWEWPKNHRRKNGGGETILGVCIKGPLEAKLWLFRVIAWEFCLSLYSSADKTNDFSMAICLYPHSFLRSRVTRPSALNPKLRGFKIKCDLLPMSNGWTWTSKLTHIVIGDEEEQLRHITVEAHQQIIFLHLSFDTDPLLTACTLALSSN